MQTVEAPPRKKTKKVKTKAGNKTKAGEKGSHRATKPKRRLDKRVYERELLRLQTELVRLAAWVKGRGLKVVALFEGRDAAGKGGAIKRITEAVSPRTCQVVALAWRGDRWRDGSKPQAVEM